MKIDLYTAESEFDRFVEAMDIDTVFAKAEDRDEFVDTKRKLVALISEGSLVINDDGEAVYTPTNKNSKHKEPITFHERTGATLMASDRKGKNDLVGKTYVMMADMCKVAPATFAGLAGRDIKTCETLFALLMA